MPPTDPVTRYSIDLMRTIEQAPIEPAPSELAERLRKRFAGQEGPGLRDARSWGEALVHAYGKTPDRLRRPWADAVLQVLQGFEGDKVERFKSGDDTARLHLTGALELAQALDWPDDERKKLRDLLRGWLRVAAGGRFPGPRNLYRERGVLGQGEVDPLTIVLRLGVRHLAWERPSNNEIWKDAAQTDGLPAEVRATRCWELARWAIAARDYNWLASHFDEFQRVLQASDWYPGNLTHLFFVTEIEHGRSRVTETIKDLARGQYLPENPDARRELARKLDYYGNSDSELKALLTQIAATREPGRPYVQSPPEGDELTKRLLLLLGRHFGQPQWTPGKSAQPD